jgi:hypothetical protein
MSAGAGDLVGIECAAFDSGHRDAIRAHLKVLLALAERQQERASQTARYHPSPQREQALARDSLVAAAIELALNVAGGARRT